MLTMQTTDAKKKKKGFKKNFFSSQLGFLRLCIWNSGWGKKIAKQLFLFQTITKFKQNFVLLGWTYRTLMLTHQPCSFLGVELINGISFFPLLHRIFVKIREIIRKIQNLRRAWSTHGPTGPRPRDPWQNVTNFGLK